jgi:hypothetical protein
MAAKEVTDPRNLKIEVRLRAGIKQHAINTEISDSAAREIYGHNPEVMVSLTRGGSSVSMTHGQLILLEQAIPQILRSIRNTEMAIERESQPFEKPLDAPGML